MMVAQRYANGFKCNKCPGRNDEQGCPAWVEFAAQDSLGRDEIKKMCLFQALPVFLIEVIKASNRPAAAIDACRGEIVAGFTTLAQNPALFAEVLGAPRLNAAREGD